MKLITASVLALVLGTGCATTPAPGTRAVDGVLVGPTGMTLYTFARDTAGSGKSACNGQCAANWPPLAAPADASPRDGYSVVTRDDGSKQWAYQGQPLYYWAKDAKPGDRTGDGVAGAWKLARP
ncbi:ATP-binding protein [Pseudorhodoferax sp.]|uniref:COG4315 family predicted lipoprotein n=1 Tax=Pseudorhodoferax sp. TaxID=1993553 RepID=UPI0039E6A657